MESRNVEQIPRPASIFGALEARQGFDPSEYGWGYEDFGLAAGGTLPAPWATAKTGANSVAGDYVNDAVGGTYALTTTTHNEAQTNRLSWGDQRTLPVTEGTALIVRWKVAFDATGAGGVPNTGDQIVVGLSNDSNATLDSVTEHAWFRIEGDDSNLNLLYEADDGTTDTNDQDTGKDIVDDTYISVGIYIDEDERANFFYKSAGARWEHVGAASIAAASSAFQPYIRVGKAAATNYDHTLTVDAVAWAWKR